MDEGAKIRAYDPLIFNWAEVKLDMEPELPIPTEFDVILFTVPHREFAELDLAEWILGCSVLIFDANNVLTKKQVSDIRENKLNYMSIGRG